MQLYIEFPKLSSVYLVFSNFIERGNSMYEIFDSLLKKHGVRAADVSKATGINQTVFSEWKKGKSSPKADKLKLIANFFGVSIDYLTSGKEDLKESESNLFPEFDALIHQYPDKTLPILSNICKTIRIEKDMTEKYLAQQCLISLDDYLCFENDRKNIGTDNILKLLTFLDINIGYVSGIITGTIIGTQNRNIEEMLDKLNIQGPVRKFMVDLQSLSSEEIKEFKKISEERFGKSVDNKFTEKIDKILYLLEAQDNSTIEINAAHDNGATEEQKKHADDIMDNDDLWK